MRKNLILFLLLIPFLLMAKGIETKVTAVTVFQNKAQVTREGKVRLSPGKQTLIFTKLPTSLNNESIRLSSDNSSVRFLDMKTETVIPERKDDDGDNMFAKKIDSLQRLIKKSQDNIGVYKSKKEFIESLKKESTEKLGKGSKSTGDWKKMLDFVGTNLSEQLEGIRKEERNIEKYKEEIEKIKFEAKKSQTREAPYKSLTVMIESERGVGATIGITYLTDDATWERSYDVRVSSGKDKAELDLYGKIRQWTREDWKDVKVTLSTAAPASVNSLPELKKWVLDRPDFSRGNNSNDHIEFAFKEDRFSWNSQLQKGKGGISGYILDAKTGEPLIGVNVILDGTTRGVPTDRNGAFTLKDITPGNIWLKISYLGYQSTKRQVYVKNGYMTEIVCGLKESSFETCEVLCVSNKDIKKYSLAEDKKISTMYEVADKNDVLSNNEGKKLTLAKEFIPITLSYYTVPKKTSQVFLQGKIVNDKEVSFPAGDMNIFIDNDYVNKSKLGKFFSYDSLDIPLGIDDKISVKRELVKRTKESSGLLSSTNKIDYHYEIIINNKGNTEVDMRVVDQFPTADNKEIKITGTEPTSSSAKIEENGIIEWNVKVPAFGEKRIPLKYTIEYPDGIEATGL